MATNTIRGMLFVAAGALCAGCLGGCAGRSFQVATAPGFVELQNQEPMYDYRASTADGVVVGIRELKHEPKGDTAFWLQAIKNRMRGMAGYALLETVDIATKGGLKGTQMRFGHDEKGEPYLYWVTIFVTDKKIYLVEMGGTKQEMTRQAGSLTWLLDNFHLT
jgi:hypothetical protein